MNILTLHTGLFADAEIIIEAADAPILDLRASLNDDQWDAVLDQILDADMIVTA